MPRINVNGTELYYEIRGTGAPLLLVMGATGDAGHFDTIADPLSMSSRSSIRPPRQWTQSRPGRWITTSPEEQADDAAGLLAALVRSPALVCGTSSGSFRLVSATYTW